MVAYAALNAFVALARHAACVPSAGRGAGEEKAEPEAQGGGGDVVAGHDAPATEGRRRRSASARR